jgi:hypothetical protein
MGLMTKSYTAPTHEEIQKHWEGLFKAIQHEQDMIIAVISTSYVDYTLSALLKGHFIDSSLVDALLNPSSGPLGSLMPKGNLRIALA